MGNIFGTGRTKGNVTRVERLRAKFVEMGSKRKAGKYGNQEAKALAGEYEVAKDADEIMTAAERDTETTMEDKIKKGRRSKVAKLRAGY